MTAAQGLSASRVVPGELLPEYRVQARNLSRYSANRIHDDAVARTYGYARGLVAGTTVYAYLTHPLVATWGRDWLSRGTASVRLLRPVYDGDDVRVRSTVVGRSGGAVAGEIAIEVEALTPRGERAATVTAGMSWGAAVTIPDPGAYPVASLPTSRETASPELLAALDPLGSPALVLEEGGEWARYADEVEDLLDLYRGVGAVAHPGLLLQQANRALSENVALGPWIHVSSDVAHDGLARAPECLTTRGRVARTFERKGRAYVELDLLVVADDSRAILHVRHTAIYRLRQAG